MNNIAIIDDFELDLKNKRVINKATGEIIDNKTEVIILLDQLKRKHKQDKAKTKKIKELFEIIYPKDKYYFNWKTGKQNKIQFIKTYRTELREYLKKVKLSPNARAFLFSIEPYIEYKTNRIAKENGDSFDNKELELIVDISSKTLKKVLNELEEKLFIKRIGETKNREIYINPYLYCSGDIIEKQTLEYFKDYIPITNY